MGDAGRGKTTFAEKLSKKFGIKKYSTDDFFWEVKFSKRRGKEQYIEMATNLFQTENSWIVEGTTRGMLKLGLDKADLIFYLTYKNTFQQIWTLYKRYRGRDHETFKVFYELVIHQYKKRKCLGKFKHEETFEDILAPYSKKVVRLESFEQIDNYLMKWKNPILSGHIQPATSRACFSCDKCTRERRLRRGLDFAVGQVIRLL